MPQLFLFQALKYKFRHIFKTDNDSLCFIFNVENV